MDLYSKYLQGYIETFYQSKAKEARDIIKKYPNVVKFAPDEYVKAFMNNSISINLASVVRSSYEDYMNYVEERGIIRTIRALEDIMFQPM